MNFRGPPGPLSAAACVCLALIVLDASLSCGEAPGTSRKPNHLVHEKSPYLQQHAYNPVDWYPWGDAAFAKARRENKPIFLSIGYSTCHWCHVMERESFENDAVAALFNRGFVCIKVDREERPDIDRQYMTAMQAMGLGGGWPLNVFLTPDLKPFFGGTYFPPDSRSGRPGLMQILPQVERAWTEKRSELEQSGSLILRHLASLSAPDSGSADRLRLFELAFQTFARSEDAEHGGFGTAPKFPTASNLAFLLRHWARDPRTHGRARALVVRQLDAMQAGGIHDVLGGGFHRYSTDRIWLVPHFEKMLYDQAQLAWAYLEAFQVTAQRAYAETAREIFTYVSRDLTSTDGAFYSAEDADSEGEEGKFYVWRPAEIEAALGPKDAPLFELRYGVTPEGNFEHGASILHESVSLEAVAKRFGLSPDVAGRRLAQARGKLLAVRAQRVRPRRDDKVLAAWNGLMISAYARGARILDEPDLATRAERAADFAWSHLYDAQAQVLKRRWRDGEAAEAGQLTDYANLARGFIDLYEATYEPRWLARAVQLTQLMSERFGDAHDGGLFDSPAGDAHLSIRFKESFDGAELAGNSIALSNLELLGTLLDREEWRSMAARGFDHFARKLASDPTGMAQMLAAMDLEQSLPRHLVIAGDPAEPATHAMLREFDRRFLPHDLLLLAGVGEARQRLDELAPFVEPLTRQRGAATAYVCVNYACQLPTTDPKAFAAQLDRSAMRGR